mgnify:CR=1 FL=1
MTDADVSRCEPITRCLDFPGTDLTVVVSLDNGELTMIVSKANKSVYRIVIEQATIPIENAWLADMFICDHRVRLAELSADVEEYVASLNISQG